MKILFLNQFYWPDASATSQLLSDLTRHLADSGDEVTVVCGSARYGDVTSDPSPNVRIVRLRNSGFSRRVGGRVGSYLSFFAGALWQALRVSSPNVVVSLTTPPLISLVGLMIQKLRGARHVIWEMDLYPDVAIDLGVISRNGIAAKLFGWLADLPRKHADRIVVLGDCMRTRLLAHGIPEERIFVAENWATCDECIEREGPAAFPPAAEPLSVLYSGNFGLAHDVETVAAAVAELRSDEPAGDIQFGFAGGGSRYGWLRSFCSDQNLNNVTFLPYCERQDLGARLASCHIGLVTQKTECLGSAVPSKTYGIMAVGRPILFIGPKTSTPAKLIERFGCGWQIDCGDVAALTRLLGELNAHRELVIDAGNRAYCAFVSHYQRAVGVTRFARMIDSQTAVEAPAQARAAAG